MGPGCTLPLIRRRRIRIRARKRLEKRRDRRLILERFSAAFQRSFRGQHGEKDDWVLGATGVIRTLGKTNSNFNPPPTGRRPHHHVKAAVDWCRICSVATVVCNSCGRDYKNARR